MKRFFWILCAAWALTSCGNEELITPGEQPLIPELPELPEQEELPVVDDVMSVIEDPYFARYCLVRFDQNGDGRLSMAEVEQAERIVYDEDTPELQADYSRFISMKGIEYFKNLKALEIRSSVLTELDLSYNSKLEELRFELPQSDCRLTKLNVSHTRLEELVIPSSEIEELLVGGSRLEKLVVYSTNGKLKSLDVRYCEDLETLSISNSSITSIDLRYCPHLRNLAISKSLISNIDLSNNADLNSLYLTEAPISSIDVSKNNRLEVVTLNDTKISAIELKNLSELYSICVSNTHISTLDLSCNEKLHSVFIDHTQISTLATDNNTYLKLLYCQGAKITNLDLSTNSRLTLLYCAENSLSDLNISVQTAQYLKHLRCEENRFASLDLSNISLIESWIEEANVDYTGTFGPQPNLEVLTLAECTQQVSLEQFTGCPKLRKVILYATEVPALIYEGEITPSGATLYVPSEAIASYQNSDWNKAFAEVRSL